MKRVENLVKLLKFTAAAIHVGASLWNIWILNRHVMNEIPPRVSDDLVVRESLYKPIRQLLNDVGYLRGPIGFVTEKDLKSEPSTEEDIKEWGEAQYTMVPWVVLRDNRGVSGRDFPNAETPFVIGDFLNGEEPADLIPKNLLKFYDSGGGLILYRSKHSR